MAQDKHRDEISTTEFVNILAKVQSLIPVIHDMKSEYERINLLLEGRESDDKTSLIREVKLLKSQVELLRVIPEIQEKIKELERFNAGLKRMPKLFAWLPSVITSSILTFVMYMILNYLNLKK